MRTSFNSGPSQIIAVIVFVLWPVLGVAGVASPVAEATRPGTPVDSLTLLFIANEGVLIELGAERVLIDGLHRPYQPMYGALPREIAGGLESAAPPFSDIDLVLVSHRHRDHFHPDAVARYLEASSLTRLVSSPQVVRETLAAGEGLEEQTVAVMPDPGESVRRSFGNISVEFLGLPHGGGRHAAIQNLGHLVELGGKRILHLGDAVVDSDTFDQFGLSERSVDVALIPYWYLLDDDGRQVVDEHIGPSLIIAVHVPPDEVLSVGEQIAGFYPDAIVFGDPLVSRVRISRSA